LALAKALVFEVSVECNNIASLDDDKDENLAGAIGHVGYYAHLKRIFSNSLLRIIP